MRATPNFTGWQAVILHREDGNTERLVRQLAVLGIAARLQWSPLAPGDLPDLVLVDADQGWDDLLTWTSAVPPRPVVALVGSEAPGRINWALSKGASAFISKPVAASAIYPALLLAISIHEERLTAQHRIGHLEERLRLRPVVLAAIGRLTADRGIDDERAYAVLRHHAMHRRQPIEQVAALFLAGSETLPEVC